MDIILANPRGFCAGVKRALLIVENALKIYKKTIYVKHEIVHNQYILNQFHRKGVIFIEDISKIPDKSIIVFSAHGVSKKIQKQAAKKKLIVLNATCPLVSKVHVEIARASKKGIETIFIGHKNHPEVEGSLGQYENQNSKIHLISSVEDVKKLSIKTTKKLYFFTQTTLSINYTKCIIAALKKKFINISGPKKEDICYATTNRQIAVQKISKKIDVLLVVGSKNSSNSNRLLELGKEIGIYTYLIDSFLDIQKKWLKNINYIGITAGASTPNVLIKEIIQYLKKIGANKIIETTGVHEKEFFNTPRILSIYKNKKLNEKE